MTPIQVSRRIVITGASSEIGTAIAKALINPDDFVLLHTFRKKNSLAAHFPANAYPHLDIVAADLTQAEALDSLCTQLGDVDILVNAAALTLTDLLPHLQTSDLAAMVAVNVTALTRICQSTIASMLRRRKGCIVNISSIVASRSNRGQCVYAGTKGYVESFSRALAMEAGSRGIRVNCVAPGAIEAGSLRELIANAPDEVRSSNASKRLGKPEDIAQAVLYLVSDKANFINGQVLHVDGGFCSGL